MVAEAEAGAADTADAVNGTKCPPLRERLDSSTEGRRPEPRRECALWNGPVYDCLLCGACCVQQGPFDGTSYVYLDRQEAKRLRRVGLTVVQGALGDSYLGCRSHTGAGGRPACVALEGKVGLRCGCSVYCERPSVCRQFEVGEALCRAARERARLPIGCNGAFYGETGKRRFGYLARRSLRDPGQRIRSARPLGSPLERPSELAGYHANHIC